MKSREGRLGPGQSREGKSHAGQPGPAVLWERARSPKREGRHVADEKESASGNGTRVGNWKIVGRYL